MGDHNLRRPTLVIYSTTPWDGLWRPRREYAEQLAQRGWTVLYTNGPLSIWDRNSEEWRQAPWLGRIKRMGGVLVDQPGRFPFRWPGRLLDRLALAWHARALRKSVKSEDRSELIAMVFDPVFLPHVTQLQPRHTVYFQYEALAYLPGRRWQFHALEEALVRRSSLLISLTPQMAQVLPVSGPEQVKILPSAVRIEKFLGAQGLDCPADLEEIPHPRIGYVGSITAALDFDLVLAVAQARPDWQFVFIGPVESGGSNDRLSDPVWDAKWQAVRALPNAHYRPQKPAAEVPSYMAHMDVNALWYRTTGEGWWLMGSPIKLYENLAVGKPVVGTRLTAVCEFSEVVELADTADEWLVAIAGFLDRGLQSGAHEQRISVARQNSWERRTEVLESWLIDMIANKD